MLFNSGRDLSIKTYGINFTANQTEYLENVNFQDVLATDWEASFVFKTMPDSNAYIVGNNTGSTSEHTFLCYCTSTGLCDLRIRETGGSSNLITTTVSFSIGDKIGFKRVGTKFSLMKNDVEQSFVTLTTAWSNPTGASGKFIVGNSQVTGSITNFSITNLEIRGERFLPTSQKGESIITSLKGTDTISVNSSVNIFNMYEYNDRYLVMTPITWNNPSFISEISPEIYETTITTSWATRGISEIYKKGDFDFGVTLDNITDYNQASIFISYDNNNGSYTTGKYAIYIRGITTFAMYVDGISVGATTIKGSYSGEVIRYVRKGDSLKVYKDNIEIWDFGIVSTDPVYFHIQPRVVNNGKYIKYPRLYLT